MARRLSIDTSFLIDLQRERVAGRDGPAHRFLQGEPDAELLLSTIALGEFAEGFEDVQDPIVRAVRDKHNPLVVDDETALVYAAVVRSLRNRGQLIGSNDLWIGCSSLRHDVPVLTADVDHFGRIDGLEVVPYR